LGTASGAMKTCALCKKEIPPGEEEYLRLAAKENILLPCKVCLKELKMKIRKRDRRKK